MRYFICIMAALFCVACQADRHHYTAVPSKGESAYGFDGISFRMRYIDVYQQLLARQVPMTPLAQGRPVIRYPSAFDGHPVEVKVHFSSAQRVDKIELVATEGYQVTDEAACDAFFQRFIASYQQHYGRPDSKAKRLKQCKQQYRYSFADSSFIDVHYQYRPDATPRCYVQAFYNPNWATMCLVTNQRFCDFVGYHVPLDR